MVVRERLRTSSLLSMLEVVGSVLWLFVAILWIVLGLGLPVRVIFFFFQAEDGIRDLIVTRVQTCALPIWVHHQPLFSRLHVAQPKRGSRAERVAFVGFQPVGNAPAKRHESSIRRNFRSDSTKIGRASCRERV